MKCFANRDDMTQELYAAIGQYLIYRAMLVESDEDIPLYLSIPEDVYAELFDVSAERVVQESRIKLVIVNLENEVIVRWKE